MKIWECDERVKCVENDGFTDYFVNADKDEIALRHIETTLKLRVEGMDNKSHETKLLFIAFYASCMRLFGYEVKPVSLTPLVVEMNKKRADMEKVMHES